MTTINATNRAGVVVAVYRPTRADIEAIAAGGLAPDVFGALSPVAAVIDRLPDLSGRLFCVYETRHAGGGLIRHSAKEGTVVRTLAAYADLTPAELDDLDL